MLLVEGFWTLVEFYFPIMNTVGSPASSSQQPCLEAKSVWVRMNHGPLSQQILQGRKKDWGLSAKMNCERRKPGPAWPIWQDGYYRDLLSHKSQQEYHYEG